MWQSLSRTAWVSLAIVIVALGAAGLWRTLGTSLARHRRVVLVLGSAIAAGVATVALLIWLNASRGIGDPTANTVERVWEPIQGGGLLDTASRDRYWEFALARIREEPWTGYGMAATPALYTRLVGPYNKEHSHNLELEAALYAGIPAALLIVLFVATSLGAAARAFLDRRPLALSVVAVLSLFFLMAQVDPVVFGSPYPSLLIVLVLAAHLQHPRDAAGRAVLLGERATARAARKSHT
jgi:O-antigen ligase